MGDISHAGFIAQGLVTCEHEGTFPIRAAFGSLKATAAASCLSATPAPPTQPSIIGIKIVDPKYKIVRSEAPHTFSAIATYSDGSFSDVSSTVTWTGSSPIAHVSDDGTAFCNTTGNGAIQLN